MLIHFFERIQTKLTVWCRITRYLGCITAFLVFIWRYLNVPENWNYVASWWSIGGMVVTLLPETIYPFVYVWAHRKERNKGKVQERSQKSEVLK
jgi:hypothetical protein